MPTIQQLIRSRRIEIKSKTKKQENIKIKIAFKILHQV